MTKIFGVILAMLGFFLVSASPAVAVNTPESVTVQADGLIILVTFDERICIEEDPFDCPTTSYDTVAVTSDGNTKAVSTVETFGQSIKIIMSDSGQIGIGEVVTVGYTAPDEYPLTFIKDADGNSLSPEVEIPSFSPISATNNSEVDLSPPALDGDAPPFVSEDRSAIVLTFDKLLQQNPVASSSSLTVTADGENVAVDGVTVGMTQSGQSTATVQLSSAIAASASVTVAFDFTTPGCNCFLGANNKWVEDFTKTDVAFAPQVAPQLASATVETNGTLLSLAFDETLAATAPAVGTITVTAGSSAVAVESIANDDDTSVLTLASAIAQGATVKVSYDAPTSGGYQDAAGNLIADFTDVAVTNNSTATATTTTTTTAPATTVPATANTTPSLVTEDNQEALTAAAGSAKLIVNGEEVEMTLSSTGADDAGATAPEDRTAAQITELQDAADGIVERLDTAAGGDSGLTVVDTDTGAEIDGIFDDTRVPVEDVIVAEADEFSGLYASRDEDGNPNKIRAEVLEMERGGEVAVYVYGLPAGESAELVLMSTPYLLGTATADSSGNFSKVLSAPEAILAGTHTLVTASETLSVSLGIKITDPASDVTLPATGGGDFSTTPVLLIVLVGAFFVVLARRRENAEN